MKTFSLLTASSAVAFALICSCGSGVKTSGEARHHDVDSLSDQSEQIDKDTRNVSNLPFKTAKFEKEVGNNKLEMEYPTEGNPQLLDSVRVWINDNLGGSYRGDLADAEKMFRHYALQLGQDPDLNEFGGYSVDEFDVEYLNDIVVTYEHTSYLYEGGAHGIGGEYGTTFLQADGTQFTRRCIKSYKAIHPFIVEGLKRFFNVKTDAELMECLLGPKSVADIPAPALDPWIIKDGVAFSYMPYEIAPYSAGRPNFIIPLDKILPYLTEEGKRFCIIE